MELDLPRDFTKAVADGSLLDIPAEDMHDIFRSMDRPTNFIAHDAAREFYVNELASSGFGSIDTAIARASKKEANRIRTYQSELGVSKDQLAVAGTAYRAGDPYSRDALEMRFYSR